MTHQTTAYPLDFDSLKKGDFIAPEVIAQATGEEIGGQRWPFLLMNLRERVELEMARRQIPVTVKTEHNGIRILTDAEAVEYNSDAHEAGVRSLMRARDRMGRIDTGELTLEERTKHERRLHMMVFECAALKNARKTLRLEQYKREGPTMLDGNKAGK